MSSIGAPEPSMFAKRLLGVFFLTFSIAVYLLAHVPSAHAQETKPKPPTKPTDLIDDRPAAGATGRYLYVVCPGIRDLLEFGGAGILVFDIDHEHRFVRRIVTPASLEAKPDNIKGVCASAVTKRLYFTTRSKLYCVDLLTEKTVWEKALPNGTDRMSLTPDGRTLYVPSFEKDTWNVVDAASGDVIAAVETKSGAHNTVVSRDGQRMYLGGLKSPILFVADTKTHELVQKVGPFAGSIRPFTVSGDRRRAYICVNDLLGFEIGDLETGKKLHRVEVQGYKPGMVKRHGCPSHGIGLTPDEREVWVVDAANERVHVFDNTADPPKQKESISLREQPGWVTFSLDGHYAYPSTGEVIDTATKKIVAALADEKGRAVHSEKMVEIQFDKGTPIAAGDQFGVGRVVPAAKVLRHVVMYKFKDSVSPREVQEVINAFAALPKKIDTIVGFERGSNVSAEGKSEGFTHVFVVTFKDEAGRDAYLKHPAHDEYVKVVKDRREKVVVFDYWAEP